VAVGKGQYVWAFNLQGATDMFRSYLGTEFWDLLRHPPRGTTINLVRAERSDRWDGESMQELAAAAKASEHDGGRDGGVTKELILESAGHWVHTDNPKGLVNLMAPSLAELS